MKHPIIDRMEARRTADLFRPDRIATDAQVDELIRTASLLPAAFDFQPWKMIAIRTAEAKSRLRKLGLDEAKITDAAVAFIICGVLTDTSPGQKPGEMGMKPGLSIPPLDQREEAMRVATVGGGMILFAADALGLTSAPLFDFDAEGVVAEFGLTPEEFPALLLVVGFSPDGTGSRTRSRARKDTPEII